MEQNHVFLPSPDQRPSARRWWRAVTSRVPPSGVCSSASPARVSSGLRKELWHRGRPASPQWPSFQQFPVHPWTESSRATFQWCFPSQKDKNPNWISSWIVSSSEVSLGWIYRNATLRLNLPNKERARLYPTLPWTFLKALFESFCSKEWTLQLYGIEDRELDSFPIFVFLLARLIEAFWWFELSVPGVLQRKASFLFARFKVFYPRPSAPPLITLHIHTHPHTMLLLILFRIFIAFFCLCGLSRL